MRCSNPILLLFAVAIGSAVPAMAGAEPDDGKAVQQQDPIEPARPTGFERRDIEEMDRKVEERRQRWWDEEEAKARAKKQRKQATEPGPQR